MTEIERLHRRHLMNNGRAIIMATNDAGGVHKVQVQPTPRELIDDVPVVQLYGYSGHAPVGSEAHMICTRGDRSSSVVIATNNGAARFKGLEQGEVAIYTDEGDYVRLSRGRIVEIKCGTKVHIDCPLVEITGDLHVQGAVIAGYGGGDQVGLQTHTHTQGGDSHGDSEQPTAPATPGT